MKRFPLLFTYRDVVRSSSFVAHVEGHGRVLLGVEPTEGFWMYGVNPGSIAAYGETPDEAHTSFRIFYRDVLNDIAGESATFDDFAEGVRAFFGQENRPNAVEWLAALEVVRRNDVALEGLPRRPADEPWTKIERFELTIPDEPRFATEPFRALAA